MNLLRAAVVAATAITGLVAGFLVVGWIAMGIAQVSEVAFLMLAMWVALTFLLYVIVYREGV